MDFIHTLNKGTMLFYTGTSNAEQAIPGFIPDEIPAWNLCLNRFCSVDKHTKTGGSFEDLNSYKRGIIL